MEIFGVPLTVWNCLTACVVIATASILVDWLGMLAWRRKYKVNSPFPLPLIGTLYVIFSKTPLNEMDDQMFKKYGTIVGGIAGGIRTLFVADVELLKKIFVKDHVQFQNRFVIEGIDPVPLDRSLFSLTDSEWKRVRNVVTPAFSPAKIKMMTKEINYCGDLLAQSLLEKAGSQEPLDIREIVGCYALDVIASSGFGIRTMSYKNSDQPFVYHANKAFGGSTVTNPWVIVALLFPRLAVFVARNCGVSFFFPKDSIKFFCEVIDKIIEERKDKDESERADLMGLLIAAQHNQEADAEQTDKKLPHKELLAIGFMGFSAGNATTTSFISYFPYLSHKELLAMGFMGFSAGYDTTTSFLSYFAYVMSTHPEVQDKLIQEIDAKYPGDKVEVKYDDLSDLLYLDQVANETLRMYPPVNKMNRMTSHGQDVEVDGHWFPANTLIQYSVWRVHHDPDLYQEPDKFTPERFSPEEKQKRDPFTFMPFGHGPRNCIGMRLAQLSSKIAIIHMLKQVKFLRCPETEEPLELTYEVLLRPKKPIKVGVECRQKK